MGKSGFYTVMEAPGVTSYVEGLPKDLREAYEHRRRELMIDPFPRRGKKTSWRLRGHWEGYYACAYRGGYRIMYSIDTERRRVYIVDVGPRGDIY